nr:lysine-rich arabinogalactan protein 19 isoform X2 [Aegilops tauschii subsp. strangulata]
MFPNSTPPPRPAHTTPSLSPDPHDHLSAPILLTTHRRPGSGEPPAAGPWLWRHRRTPRRATQHTAPASGALPPATPTTSTRHPPPSPRPRRTTLSRPHGLDAPPVDAPQSPTAWTRASPAAAQTRSTSCSDPLSPAVAPTRTQTHLLQPSPPPGPENPPAATHPRRASRSRTSRSRADPMLLQVNCDSRGRSISTGALASSLASQKILLPLKLPAMATVSGSSPAPLLTNHRLTIPLGDLQLGEVSNCSLRRSRPAGCSGKIKNRSSKMKFEEGNMQQSKKCGSHYREGERLAIQPS